MSSGRSRPALGRLERQLIEVAGRQRAGAMVRALGLDPLAPYGGLERCPVLAQIAEEGLSRRALIALALRRAGVSRLRPLVLAEVGGGEAGRVYREALVDALSDAAYELDRCAVDWQDDRWCTPDWRGYRAPPGGRPSGIWPPSPPPPSRSRTERAAIRPLAATGQRSSDSIRSSGTASVRQRGRRWHVGCSARRRAATRSCPSARSGGRSAARDEAVLGASYHRVMEPYEDKVVTLAMMVGGYREALERLNEASASENPSATFCPLFEALNWAVALDERISKLWAPAGKPLGLEWRDEAPDAKAMAGVRFARNRVHHNWADAIEVQSGLGFPLRFPMNFVTWLWRGVEDLPTDRPDAVGEQVYADRLQGRPVSETLITVQGAFDFVLERVETVTWRSA